MAEAQAWQFAATKQLCFLEIKLIVAATPTGMLEDPSGESFQLNIWGIKLLYVCIE